MLKVHCPNFRLVLGICRFDLVAERKMMERSGSAEAVAVVIVGNWNCDCHVIAVIVARHSH